MYATGSKTTGFFAKLHSLFKRSDPEDQRRQWLTARGRIIEGLIIDVTQQGRSVSEKEVDPNKPCIIFYRYSTASVTYESSQALSTSQLTRLKDYRLGSTVSVRYDPRRPGNSFVE
ncbi:MAG: DUF3592 domain-containing protein [Blastocatellia bacterium]|nr:DUF3592 domain-containing protein [Blastocatellia bacterium]